MYKVILKKTMSKNSKVLGPNYSGSSPGLPIEGQPYVLFYRTKNSDVYDEHTDGETKMLETSDVVETSSHTHYVYFRTKNSEYLLDIVGEYK